MQTQDSQLKQIQAGNEEVRKKLQVFRSGLQRLMSKKSSKKSQRHEPPSQDIKKSISNHQPSPNYKTYNPPVQSPQNNKLQHQQFGFNSTLFRQINDQTVLSNNSSGVNYFYGNNNIGHYDNNYESVGSLNSQKTGQYFSASTKKSDQIYDYQTSNAINSNDKFPQQRQSQSFKKSSLLFSEIDQLMNKVNKSSKLPIKPIQKYINQQQSKLKSDSREIDLTLSNSSVIVNSDQKRGKFQFQQLTNKQKNVQVKSSRSFKKDQVKIDKGSARQSLKQTTSFLKNMKQRSSSIQGIKQPPLPPTQSSIKLTNKVKQTKKQEEDFLEWGKKISQKNRQAKDKQQHNLEQQKTERQGIVRQQKIANKIKSTLNERKKLIKQQGLMDESIQLQLSSQQQEDKNNEEKQKNSKILADIKKLQQQKELLLNQLKLIESQLQQLQSQL